MRKWRIAPQVPIPDGLLTVANGNPLVATALARRGIKTFADAESFIFPEKYRPTPAEELPGMEASVERLSQAIREGEPICVWGDFDADGQTSTAILVSTLRELGARVSYHIPVRAEESHGISTRVLRRWLEDRYRLFLTCDTGISAHEAVDYANQQGAEVIITDHHILPEILPQAFSFINPRCLPVGHPLSSLPGAGVAYKLAEALYSRFGNPEAAETNLDLVAIGIVADLAGIKGDTRYLLQRGISALKTTPRLGLIEMLSRAEIQPESLSEEHIAFSLAPRLNALGRLADANPAVELLTTNDQTRARILANELEGLNAQRRYLTGQVLQAAVEQIEKDPTLLKHATLILKSPTWPAGVIGIVASRLVERFQKPVILLVNAPGEVVRGSARSIPGCDITQAIASQAGLLIGYGGHPMAAGLSILSENIESFQRGLDQAVAAQLGSGWEEPPLEIDGTLPLNNVASTFVELIERLAPFGPENPSLTWISTDLQVQSIKSVGRNGEHRVASLQDGDGKVFEAIWWQGSDFPSPEGKIDLAYSVRTTDYRGQKGVSIEWVDSRPAEAESLHLSRNRRKDIVDFRKERDPKGVLKKILEPGMQVWREGQWCQKMDGRTRQELQTGTDLIIWTPPPSISILRVVIKMVNPKRIYLFNNASGYATVQEVITTAAQFAKYALSHYNGCIKLRALAARCGHREATVLTALEWLQAKGVITIENRSDDEIFIQQSGVANPETQAALEKQLKALLDDTEAYRDYYARAEMDILVERDMG